MKFTANHVLIIVALVVCAAMCALGALIKSEPLLGIFGSGGGASLLAAIVFIVRGGGGPGAPTTTGIVLLVGGLALGASACGAATKVRTEVRAADTAVNERIAAHGCGFARVGHAVRAWLIDGEVVPALERAKGKICAGAVIQKIADIILGVLGRDASDVAEGLFSSSCADIFKAMTEELTAGTEQLGTATDDICTSEAESSPGVLPAGYP